jgi:hypothetical protein
MTWQLVTISNEQQGVYLLITYANDPKQELVWNKHELKCSWGLTRGQIRTDL